MAKNLIRWRTPKVYIPTAGWETRPADYIDFLFTGAEVDAITYRRSWTPKVTEAMGLGTYKSGYTGAVPVEIDISISRVPYSRMSAFRAYYNKATYKINADVLQMTQCLYGTLSFGKIMKWHYCYLTEVKFAYEYLYPGIVNPGSKPYGSMDLSFIQFRD